LSDQETQSTAAVVLLTENLPSSPFLTLRSPTIGSEGLFSARSFLAVGFSFSKRIPAKFFFLSIFPFFLSLFGLSEQAPVVDNDRHSPPPR